MIGADGAQLGIMSARDALNLAAEKNLDLVKIAPQATPPVCKIIDYGNNYLNRQSGKGKDNQRVVESKRFVCLNIDTYDFETKRNHAIRFNDETRSRFPSVSAAERWVIRRLGADIMKCFSESLADTANVDKPAKPKAQHADVPPQAHVGNKFQGDQKCRKLKNIQRC